MTITVSIRRVDIKVGGMFVVDPGIGSLTALAGEGLSPSAAGLTHTAPKAAVSGVTTFRFAWRSPSSPGATRLELYALAANGDGQPTGDAPGRAVLPIVYGCAPQPFYFDADGDGFGAHDFPSTIGCAGAPPPTGYAVTDADCDDNHDAVHPGATETCNGRDDDCDGQVDNGASAVEMWPDTDGDGYYGAKSGTMVLGCPPLLGYAAERGDCAEFDATRHPGASEICNFADDNCNGKVDEGVRPQCGIGLCRRESVSCRSEDCVEGIPSVESCNALDDDCNGLVDDSPDCALAARAGAGGTSSGDGGAIQVIGGSTPQPAAESQRHHGGCAMARTTGNGVQWGFGLVLLGCCRTWRSGPSRRRRTLTGSSARR